MSTKKTILIGAIELLGNAIEEGSKQDQIDHFHDVYIKAQNLGLKDAVEEDC